MRRVAILGLVAVLSTACPIHAQTTTTPSATQASAPALYEEGKKLYDAGDYVAARARFSEAIRRDPENPRWHYNLALVQRQLENYQAARQSFLRARELAPDYKRAEIDEKLQSMGFDPASGAETQAAGRHATHESVPDDDEGFDVPWAFVIAGGSGLIAVIGLGIFLVSRQSRRHAAEMSARIAPMEAAALVAEESRLAALSAQLIRIEHAMRLGEHADLRSQLEYATRIETAARRDLAQCRQGDRSARAKLKRNLDDAGKAAQQATDLATRLYGERAFAEAGDKVGCFFCARPLANPQTRQMLAMQRGDSRDEVLACPDCAAKAGRGEAPAVRTGPDGQTHWSELPDYDPYARRHADIGNCRDVPAWRYQPQRPMGEIARLAGGGALGLLAGAGAAMAATALLDLDAAREAGRAQEALQASAKRATEQRSETRFSDHS